MRVALYSHDSVGLGHVRRNLAIARAVAAEHHTTGLLLTGQSVIQTRDTPAGWDWVTLPGIAPASGGYRSRELRVDGDTIGRIRSSVAHAAIAEFEPDVLIVDRHLYGASGELRPALATLRARHPRTRIVLGLRDVLDAPAAASAEWERGDGVAGMLEHIDDVWIYGDPAVHDPIASGEIPAAVAERATFMGYLSSGRQARGNYEAERPYVATMVGGGSDGAALAEAATLAPRPAGVSHLVVAGPQMPEADVARLRRIAPDGVTIRRRVPDGLALIRSAQAVVTMAGYNTVAETLSTSVPALVAPREHRRMEQRIRADALAAAGALDVLPSGAPSPAAIGAWLADVVGRSVDRGAIRLDGLARVAAAAGAATPAAAVVGGVR